MEKKSRRKTEKNERNGNQDQRLKYKSRPLEIESTISTAAKRAVGTRIRKFEKKTEFDKLKKQNNHVTELKNQELEELRPKGHSYLVCVIETAIKFLITGLNSLRGIERNFEILTEHWIFSTPNFNTIRQWSLRLGLYEFNRQKEYREDWIFILDMTIELGAAKCLVILGISQEKFTRIVKEEVRSLQHEDLEVLSLEIMDKSPGTVILEKLKKLAECVGTPVQIISDWGSDIKKGINLYKEENPGVILTYDITHKMANLLKKELLPDKKFQSFLRQCSLTRQRVQQTKLYFLIPPKQRIKARYHNVDILIKWAIKVIEYEKYQDFSQISTTYNLDDEALFLLSFTLRVDIFNILKNLTPFVYQNRQEFTEALKKHLGEEFCVAHEEIICQYSDLGRRSFYKKFGWLFNYEQDIDTYTKIFTQIHSVQKQIKTQGLHSGSLEEWLKTISIDSLTPRGQNFHEKIIEYLTFETHQIPVDQVLLGTSDVVESLFGKYKFFAARRPLKDIGASILLIPLFTLKITTNLVRQAMESIRFIDVISWTESIFGSSMLSQRRNLKSANISDTEPA